MCGIVGFVERGGCQGWQSHLDRAIASLSHRGPDDSGRYMRQVSEFAIGLGHRRLTIRDLTSAGRQPFVATDERFAIVCNGEIYNADDLRRDLEARGHHFKSRSDNEVVLHGFEAYGPRILDRLEGMFALAVWDAVARRLWMARDRMGIKPLLYARTTGGIVFGSELRVVSCWPGVSRTISRKALHQYLTFGYTLAPLTMMEQVLKVQPAHVVCYDAARETLSQNCYWNLADAFNRAQNGADHGNRSGNGDGNGNGNGNGNSVTTELWDRLTDSVDRRRASDVPLGSFLSGGVDSSTISALLGAGQSGAMTFCTDFPESSFSEARHALRTAQSLGLRHKCHAMTPPRPEEMSALVAAADEPTADSSFIPYHNLCAFARQDVTVALSGDGADELLAGYITYRADRYHRYARWLPGPARRWMAHTLAPAIQPGRSKVGASFKLRQFLAAADENARGAHARWRCLWQPRDVAQMLTPSLLGELADQESDPLKEVERYFEPVAGLPFLQQSLYVDLSTWLVDDILHKVDRASMAHGLEVRVPFLDHRLVEWCASLPGNLKLRGRTGKWLLRKTLRERCPQLVHQRGKQGFNAPVGHWLNGPLESWANDVLSHGTRSACADWLRHDGAHVRYMKDHREGGGDHGFKLWGLLWLIEWCRLNKATL